MDIDIKIRKKYEELQKLCHDLDYDIKVLIKKKYTEKITLEDQGDILSIRYFHNSPRFREWSIPKKIVGDVINIHDPRMFTKYHLKNCVVKVLGASYHIQRLDEYSQVGYTLPIQIVNYLKDHVKKIL